MAALNLVMTIVGHTFSRDVDYAFHIDSGTRVGAISATSATLDILCRFASMREVDCRIGYADHIAGDPTDIAGLTSDIGHAKLYAGLRDDPFFNNVKGSRDAFNFAAAALRKGVQRDAAGCPLFDAGHAREIRERWGHTNGGPAQDFLAGWTPASIVIAVDLPLLTRGGPLLAVWADTSIQGVRIDRAGRPLTGNALLGPLEMADVSDAMKLRYNEATPATGAAFVPEIEKSLALYDGYDGHCGNQLFIDAKAPPAQRYTRMATLLADDRLWVNSASAVCTRLFAVEIAAADGRRQDDCGGRAPSYDASNVYRSLLATGAATGISDGVIRDGMPQSDGVFPFLAAPAAAAKEY